MMDRAIEPGEPVVGSGALIMGYGESAIRAVDWQAVPVRSGTGADLRAALLALLRCTTDDEAEQLWPHFENVVFAQSTVYGAAEQTVGVLMAALADDRPRVARNWILELLFYLLMGGSSEDPSLPGRCRDRARPGLWLLAREARVRRGRERELVLDLVESIDPGEAGFMRDSLTTVAQPDGAFEPGDPKQHQFTDYGLAPIPDPRDDLVGAVVDRAVSGGPAVVAELSASASERGRRVFLAYAERMSSLAVRRSDPAPLVGAVVAVVLGGLDQRVLEALMVLPLVENSARLLGVKLPGIFEEAAAVVGHPGSASLVTWLMRKPQDRSVAVMGFAESSDEGGFRYEFVR